MPDSAETAADDYASEWASLIHGRESTSICDVDGLSGADIRFLGRLGLWPDNSSRESGSTGSPYVFDAGKYRSLHFDWDSVQSEMNREDPVALTIDYTRVMMAFLLFDQSPARIEMIGLGGGSLAKLCHCLLPDTDITVVEIDDKVIALREQFLVPPESDRFRVVYADGADHVRRSRARPDVLLVDGFDADGQPPQLCSPFFYSRCYDRMTPGGLLIINLWGGDPDHRRHVGKLERHFEGDIIVLPTEGGTNRAIIARKDASLALTDTQSAFAHALFPQPQAAFLPSIGERLRRELDRRTSAML